jgi:F-type H+-transporting ATPase subunit a
MSDAVQVSPVQPAEEGKKVTKKALIIFGSILLLEILETLLFPRVHPSMDRVTEMPHNMTHLFGWQIPFGGINPKVVLNTWFVMGIMIVLAVIGRWRLQTFPGRRQGIFEMVIILFDNLCQESLGKKLGRKFVPYIVTVFFFILISNWLLMLYMIPWIEEPTISLNTTLALGTIAFFVAHITGICVGGFRHYISHYFEPMITIGPLTIPNFLFFPLHVIGELGKVVSHSFRLFGNILGGAIIYVVVTALIHHWVLPPALHLFFGIFVGAIQAFVFTLLAMTYASIQVGASEEEEHAS